MDSNKKTKQKTTSSSSIEKICKIHGVNVSVDEFSLSFMFDDGKVLKYALHPGIKQDIEKAIKSVQHMIRNGTPRGRLFKDGKFIGYVGKNAKTLEEIFIFVDMLVL
jgi:hypothetical protein